MKLLTMTTKKGVVKARMAVRFYLEYIFSVPSYKTFPRIAKGRGACFDLLICTPSRLNNFPCQLSSFFLLWFNVIV